MGYKRLCQDRACLLPYLQSDVSVRPPYAATQISEAALRREIDRIHASAVDETKVHYDRGMAEGAASVGSWVVRWLLWYMLLHGDEAIATDDSDAGLHARRRSKTSEEPQHRPIDGVNATVNVQLSNHDGMFGVEISIQA